MASKYLRHRLTWRHAPHQGYICTCGHLAPAPDLVRHVRQARRWRYLGRELVAGEWYHLWEQQLTGRRFAILADTYTAENSRRTRQGK